MNFIEAKIKVANEMNVKISIKDIYSLFDDAIKLNPKLQQVYDDMKNIKISKNQLRKMLKDAKSNPELFYKGLKDAFFKSILKNQHRLN